MEPRERYLQVAQLHVRCLDQGFLATLGERFLALMYEAIDAGQDSTLLTIERNGEIAGFITGGVGMSSIYREMMRKPIRLAGALAPALFNVSRLRRIFEILRYGGGDSVPANLPGAELLSLAVAPEWRGKGLAEDLYQSLVERFQQRGVDAFRIIVGEALEPAHRFYRRVGAVAAGQVEVHEGELSTVYIQLSIPDRDARDESPER